MRTLFTRALGIVAALAMCAGTASAYYFYVHYNSRNAPFSPIFEKFDLSSLQNNTVYFYISDAGPAGMPAGDSFTAIVSEIRSAADKWNSVATSALRVQYAGLYNSASGQVNSGITVDFSNDLPPGVIALGGPVTYAGPNNGQFVPILRSTVRIQNDLSQPSTACSNTACPSYSEYFFTTMVHEFGHAFGLQHTFTSAVMSTAVTSAATKAAPLAPDDIAGISVLYPTDGYLSTVGSISGRVTVNGSGVSLASVVALTLGSPAISTLTNPDGTYRIDGVPPAGYQLYVHPLPAALQTEASPGNLVAPKDASGNPFPFPTTAFSTQFYDGSGGTQNFLQTGTVWVNPGSVNSGVNFQVRSRPFAAVSSVRVYGYSSTNVPIASPPVTEGGSAALVAYGTGLLQSNNTLTPNLAASVLDDGSRGQAQISGLAPYVSGYVTMVVNVGTFASLGPQHLLFNTKDDMYVLPSAFAVVNQPPPSITALATAVDASGNRIVEVSGTYLTAGSTILFDGLPGAITGVADDGDLFVTPPPGPGGYHAVVTALNADGQSSNFLQSPLLYTYDASAAPSLAVSPALLSPGSSLVDVVGTNTNFIAGQVAAGFGSSDAVVNKVTVLSPTHLVLNVTVNANAIVPATWLNVVNGLQLIAQSQGSTITLQPPPSKAGR